MPLKPRTDFESLFGAYDSIFVGTVLDRLQMHPAVKALLFDRFLGLLVQLPLLTKLFQLHQVDYIVKSREVFIQKHVNGVGP